MGSTWCLSLQQRWALPCLGRHGHVTACEAALHACLIRATQQCGQARMSSPPYESHSHTGVHTLAHTQGDVFADVDRRGGQMSSEAEAVRQVGVSGLMGLGQNCSTCG